MGLSSFEVWVERFGGDALEGLSFSRPTINGPLLRGGAIAATYEVEVSRHFWHSEGAVMKYHKEGHKRLQMMVLTHSSWWCALPCSPRIETEDAEPETFLSPNASKGV